MMPARFVKPNARSNKIDFNNAAAIAEAVRRPTMRFVTTKTTEQHDLQALQRVRDHLVRSKIGNICQLRSLLLEIGIADRTGRKTLGKALPEILEGAEQPLSDRMRAMLHSLREKWLFVD